MKIRLTKDYRHYEILYDSQEEAIAVKDYLDQLLVRGVDIPNKTTVETFRKTDTGKELHRVSGVAELAKENAEWQHEQENSTGNK